MITIYGKPSCGYCNQAKQLVKSMKMEYEYKDISLNQYRTELLERAPHAKTVPQIWWGNRYIGGYDKLVREIEDTAGGYGESGF